LLEMYPALAACFSPLTAFFICASFTTMRIVAMEEDLVID
jgi:hypothetical protein